MNTFFKYVLPIALAIGLIGCQKNSKTKGTAASPQQNKGQLMQQPPADINVSDTEVDKFVQAAMNIQNTQIKFQQKMINLIQSNGLKVKTYRKIAQYAHNKQTTPKPNVSDEQMKAYQQASKALKKAQKNLPKKMRAAVEDAGLTKKQFKKINKAIRYDSTLRQTIRAKMKELAQKKLHPDSSSQ